MNTHSNIFVARWFASFFARLLGLAFVAASCGGTYTNEDIEYQAVVPARGHLVPRVAAQRVAGSAEYYQLTVTMAEVYGGVLDPVADVLERVRRHPATSRTAAGRIW